MIQFIVGTKGSGKTKTMIDMINKAAAETKGDIVCIEKNMNLTYDIKHSVRLIDLDDYSIDGYEEFYGFVAGVLAGNYDIMEIYVDGILRVGAHDLDGFEKLIEKLEPLAGENVKMIITVSEKAEALPAALQKYIS